MASWVTAPPVAETRVKQGERAPSNLHALGSSVDQHGRLVNVASIVDLADEEIGDV
jgi:hypothetical protein